MADRRTTFIQTYMPYAQEASAMTGIDPSVILAQAAHETGWGRKAPGNNFFGIKGGGQTFATHEYIGGKRVNLKAGFRRYDDPRGSFLDWAKLMQTPRYAKVLAAQTPEEQIKALKAAGYATDPAYVSKLNSVRSQVAEVAGEVAPAGAGGIMDVAALNDGTSTVPYQPTAAQGFAPDLGGVRDAPAQTAIADMLAGGQSLTPEQIDQLTMTDAAGNYLNPPSLPPTPQSPPQWASAQGFPIDESLTGRSAQDVLAGGPRMDPRRAPPGSGPVPADMGAMRSPLDVLNAGPNLDPRRAIASGPVGPTTPQGVLDMGPNLRPPNVPTPPMRPERGAGIPDPRMRPDPASLPQRGFPTAFGEQPPALMDGMSAAMGSPPPRVGDMSATMGGPPSRTGDLSASMGGPPDPFADFGQRDLAAELQGQRTIADANYYRPQNIMAPPPLAGGMSAAMGGPPAPPPPPDFTAASDPAPALTLNDPYANQRRPSSFETAQQNFQMPEGWTPGGDAPPPPAMFNPPYNQAAEWFKGNTPGYTDTAFNNAPLPPPPTPTPTAPSTAAQGNPFDALLGPGAAMAAIPFNDVSQGIGSPDFGNARAASVWDSRAPGNLGLDGPTGGTVAPPSPALMSGASAFYRPDAPDPTFAGGSVVDPGLNDSGAGATAPMPGRSFVDAKQYFAHPPAPSPVAQSATMGLDDAPRQTNVGAEKQRNNTLARAIGGGLLGPVGAFFGGLLGGGGGVFGGGSTTPMGASFSSPYMQSNGQMGNTNVQRIQSGNMQGTAWNRNGGGSVGYVTDPFTGSMIYTSSPTTY